MRPDHFSVSQSSAPLTAIAALIQLGWKSVKCPLCNEDTGNGNISVTSHLAKHLEEISLSALPAGVDSNSSSEIGSDASDAEPRAETVPECESDVEALENTTKPSESSGQRNSDASTDGEAAGASNDDFPHGIDPAIDPKLALALHMDMEEEKALKKKQNAMASDGEADDEDYDNNYGAPSSFGSENYQWSMKGHVSTVFLGHLPEESSLSAEPGPPNSDATDKIAGDPVISSHDILHRAAVDAWTGADDLVFMDLRAARKNWNQIQREAFSSKTSEACRRRHARLTQLGAIDTKLFTDMALPSDYQKTEDVSADIAVGALVGASVGATVGMPGLGTMRQYDDTAQEFLPQFSPLADKDFDTSEYYLPGNKEADPEREGRRPKSFEAYLELLGEDHGHSVEKLFYAYHEDRWDEYL